jgi:hypothetical protein
MPEPADTADDAQNPGIPLVAALVQQSYDNYASTTQQLIDSLLRQVAGLQAELDCIRANVQAAYQGPYAPNPDWVLGLLYPDEAAIAPYLEEPAS